MLLFIVLSPEHNMCRGGSAAEFVLLLEPGLGGFFALFRRGVSCLILTLHSCTASYFQTFLCFF